MKLVKYDKFLEATLNIGLLKTKTNGLQRGDILVKELEKPNPKLTLDITGKKVDIDPENAEKISQGITNTQGEYDDTLGIEKFINDKNRYLPVIKGEKGGEYKLNDFREKGLKTSIRAQLKDYKIDFDEHMLHNSMYDVRMNFKIFLKQIWQIEI